MSDQFQVTMHGSSGDMEIYENVGTEDGRSSIDSWDDAIRAAWNSLQSYQGGPGWEAATIVRLGPWGATIRLSADDKRALWTKELARINEKGRVLDQMRAEHPEECITLGGDPDDTESPR